MKKVICSVVVSLTMCLFVKNSYSFEDPWKVEFEKILDRKESRLILVDHVPAQAFLANLSGLYGLTIIGHGLGNGTKEFPFLQITLKEGIFSTLREILDESIAYLNKTYGLHHKYDLIAEAIVIEDEKDIGKWKYREKVYLHSDSVIGKEINSLKTSVFINTSFHKVLEDIRDAYPAQKFEYDSDFLYYINYIKPRITLKTQSMKLEHFFFHLLTLVDPGELYQLHIKDGVWTIIER